MAKKKLETSEEQVNDKVEATVVEETTVAEPEEETVEEDIIDVDLDAKDHIAKIQRYRIAKDNNRIIELDVGDGVGVVKRFSQAYKNIQDNLNKTDLDKSEDFDATLKLLEKQEGYIREQINYIFGTDVCTPVLQDMSVLAMKNGTYAFEYVITEIFKFYEASIAKEANAVKARISKHTSKYW